MSDTFTGSDDLVVDHIEFYVADVGSLRKAFTDGYGFEMYATAAPDPDGAAPRSVALGRDDIRLVLTEASGGDHVSSAYVQQHGDGVGVIALGTGDACAAFTEAVGRGAAPVAEPAERHGVVTASVMGFGDVVHKFVQRPVGTEPRVLPGLTAVLEAATADSLDSGLQGIDHFAVCLEAGQLDPTVAFYEHVLGFRMIFEERISVGAQAMNSKVVQSVSGAVTLTLIEPDLTKEPGQIDDFLKRHGGPGVQHIAFTTNDIVRSVGRMREREVAFLTTPGTYYNLLSRRIELGRHSVDELRDLNVLVDEDHDGQLFQIFTRTAHSRGTLFMEVIERFGANTFGGGNIKALYEAVELQRTAEEARA